jgi:cytochrome b
MSERPANAAQDTRRVRVWDLPSRLFHWLLVALIGAQWLTANGDVSWMWLHQWGGYAILALVIWRLLWGFVGSPTARFANFLRGPRAVTTYARGLLHEEHPVIIGHNPLGGWSVVLMLLLIALQAGTGLFSSDDILTEGPLAHLVGSDWVGFLTAVHHISFNLLLALVVLHIGAVFLHLFVGEDDLVTPMLTGRKRIPATTVAPDRAFAGNLRAVVLLLCVVGLLWVVLRL